jgi:membrane fusion protein (multidrug efflux system)
VVVLLGGLRWYLNGGNGGSNGQGQQRPATSVRTTVVAPERFATEQTFNGSLQAQQAIDILSELRGRITRIGFDNGMDVTAGEVLVEIDSTELRAEQQALSSELRLAESNLARLQGLRESDGITERDLDEARSRRDVLAADLDGVAARLEKAVIRAPFDGTLGLRHVTQGQLIEPDTLITTLQNLDHLYVDFSVPERYGYRLNRGDKVTFRTVRDETDRTATVVAVDPRVDLITRTVTVRAQYDNGDRSLLPGAFARVGLPVVVENAIVVDAVAVVRGLNGAYVFVVEDGTARRRDVSLGQRTAARVVINEGVQAGEEVVVSGIQALRDGAEVNVVQSGEQS